MSSIEDDMAFLDSSKNAISGSIPNTPSGSDDPDDWKPKKNNAGGSIYQRMSIMPEHYPVTPNRKIYMLHGWMSDKTKPDRKELVMRVARMLAEKDYLLRFSVGEIESLLMKSAISSSPPTSLILPFDKFEPRVQINFNNVIPLKVSMKYFKINAAYDPTFNEAKVGYQMFSAARTAAMIGDDSTPRVSFLLLYTWDGECSTADIKQRTNPSTATLLRIADDLGIPVYNLNNANSLEEFMGFLKSDEPKVNNEVPKETTPSSATDFEDDIPF